MKPSYNWCLKFQTPEAFKKCSHRLPIHGSTCLNELFCGLAFHIDAGRRFAKINDTLLPSHALVRTAPYGQGVRFSQRCISVGMTLDSLDGASCSLGGCPEHNATTPSRGGHFCGIPFGATRPSWWIMILGCRLLDCPQQQRKCFNFKQLIQVIYCSELAPLSFCTLKKSFLCYDIYSALSFPHHRTIKLQLIYANESQFGPKQGWTTYLSISNPSERDKAKTIQQVNKILLFPTQMHCFSGLSGWNVSYLGLSKLETTSMK